MAAYRLTAGTWRQIRWTLEAWCAVWITIALIASGERGLALPLGFWAVVLVAWDRFVARRLGLDIVGESVHVRRLFSTTFIPLDQVRDVEFLGHPLHRATRRLTITTNDGRTVAVPAAFVVDRGPFKTSVLKDDHGRKHEEGEIIAALHAGAASR